VGRRRRPNERRDPGYHGRDEHPPDAVYDRRMCGALWEPRNDHVATV